MESNVVEELQKIIVKSLPEATANEMKKFIQEAEELKAQNKILSDELKSYKSSLRTAQDRLCEFQKKQAVFDALEEREKDITKFEQEVAGRERSLDMAIMKTKMEGMERERSTVTDLVTKVFGHPSVTVTNTSTSRVTPEKDQYGNAIYPDEFTDIDTSTTTTGKQ